MSRCLARILGGVGLVALAGCLPAPPTRVLPDALAAVVLVSDGQGGTAPLSLLVQLPRPGVEPSVRLGTDAVAMDLGWAARLTVDGARVRAEELGPDGHAVEGAGRPLAVGRDGLVLETDTGVSRLAFGAAVAAAPSPDPAREITHPGPGQGFATGVRDGALALRLPRHDGDGDWEPVLPGVEGMLGGWWLRLDDLPPWQRRVLDDGFKRVDAVPRLAGTAVADGDASEWRGTVGLRVDDAGQLYAGQADWGGPRDAGFGVATRADGDGGDVLVVRIRDDHFVAGMDHLSLAWEGGQREVLLAPEAGAVEGGARGPRRAGEQVVELLLPAGAADSLVVSLYDTDPEEGTTVLATAPGAELLALGRRIRVPDTPLRAPGR